jgi:hypothetical protein
MLKSSKFSPLSDMVFGSYVWTCTLFKIHIYIKEAFDKTLTWKLVVKKIVPNTWGLFKVVEGFEQAAHICFDPNCNKTLKLGDIGFLL